MIYRGWPIENWILHSYVKLPKAIIDDSSPTCLESRHISYIWVCLEIGHPLSNGSSLSIMFHHVFPYLSSNLGEYQILGHPHMVNQLNKPPVKSSMAIGLCHIGDVAVEIPAPIPMVVPVCSNPSTLRRSYEQLANGSNFVTATTNFY